MSVTWLAIFCACSSDYWDTRSGFFSVVLNSILPKCSKDCMKFLISSFKNMTSGASKAILKFKIREEGGNVVVLLNWKVLEGIMQENSIFILVKLNFKIVFLKYHFKIVFYYPCLAGDICLGCSLYISEGIRKTPPWKTNW